MMNKKERETLTEMFANIRGRVLATIEKQIEEFFKNKTKEKYYKISKSDLINFCKKFIKVIKDNKE